MKVHIIIGIWIILILNACTSEPLSLSTPSEYKYTLSKVKSQNVFEVNNGILTETTQHPFDESLKLVNDSIETIMNSGFEIGQVTSFLFKDNKNVVSKGHIENNPFEIEGHYSLNGLNLVVEHQENHLVFSENYEELYLCSELTLIKGKTSTGQQFIDSNINLCSSSDPKKSAQSILDNNVNSPLEYVAVIFVDMVYKKQQ